MSIASLTLGGSGFDGDFASESMCSLKVLQKALTGALAFSPLIKI